jgi:hypothetical protein
MTIGADSAETKSSGRVRLSKFCSSSSGWLLAVLADRSLISGISATSLSCGAAESTSRLCGTVSVLARAGPGKRGAKTL